MRNLLPKSVRPAGLRALLLAPAVVIAAGCTELTETPKDSLTPDNAFRTETEILAGVAGVYAGMRGPMWGYYNLSEVSTDEIIVPTRGNDWYDNGRWLEIHRQEWSPNSGSALDDMNGTWNDLFSGVARANLMIEVIEAANLTQARKDTTLAELRTLRAWYYYMLMDMFGRVPLVTAFELKAQPQVSRAELFDFIASELREVRANLPETRPAGQYARIARGAADAILASLYLNAAVFRGTPSATAYNSCQAVTIGAGTACDSAIAAANRVINSGRYQMAADWKGNFGLNNEGSPENIFVVAHVAQDGLGLTIAMRGLHYRQLVPEPWNGFATLAETYRAFDPNDRRREVFLIGQQFSYNTGQPVTDRGGAPLVFTDTIGNAESAAENEGARLMKFPPLPNAPNGNHPNDFPWYRLAEMYLIRAEARGEQNDIVGALADINLVRARQFDPDEPVAGASTAEIRTLVLNERLFELAGEAKRRQDLIRHGRYTAFRRICSASIPDCEKPARGDHIILMPIPQTQLANNPLLTQNPGY